MPYVSLPYGNEAGVYLGFVPLWYFSLFLRMLIESAFDWELKRLSILIELRQYCYSCNMFWSLRSYAIARSYFSNKDI